MTLPDKYEFKRFIKVAARSTVVAAHLGPSRSAASIKLSSSSSSVSSNPSRSQTLPPAASAPAEPSRAQTMSQHDPPSTTTARSFSQPISSQAQLQSPQAVMNDVWSDLATLQGPVRTSTLPLQYLSSTTSSLAPILASHPNAGGSSLGASFPPTIGLGPSLGVSVSQGVDTADTSVATRPIQPSFVPGTSTTNPFAYMTAQQQAQVQAPQNGLLSTSPFRASLSQQFSSTSQAQIPQAQQPAFSPSVTNPFFNATAQFPGTLSPQPTPQPQAPFISNTPSPGPFIGSPFQQPTQTSFPPPQPLFQQPTQTPFQPQPPQFGNVQPSDAALSGNPFTSWLTQQPNSYASTRVVKRSERWGTM
jgi:stromal membrane-associated protein